MNTTAALLAGFLTGLAIATQVGAVSLLLIDASLAAGPRAGAAAGLGVATVDLAFAVVAVLVGAGARAALAGYEPELRAGAALVLSAIAIQGLRSALRGRPHTAHGAAREGPGPDPRRRRSPLAQYLRFLAITVVNPLTIVSFASVAASLSLSGFPARGAFVIGVGAASAGWHVMLTIAAGHAGRRITPPVQRGLAIGGRLLVLGVAVRLALAI